MIPEIQTSTPHSSVQGSQPSPFNQRLHLVLSTLKCTASYEIESSWSGGPSNNVRYQQPCGDALKNLQSMVESGEHQEYHVRHLEVCRLGSKGTCKNFGNFMSVKSAITRINSQIKDNDS